MDYQTKVWLVVFGTWVVFLLMFAIGMISTYVYLKITDK
jgi:hypothetical protein